MPIGQFKGIDVDMLPSPYMRFMVQQPYIRKDLREAMQAELKARGSEEPCLPEEE